MSRCDFWSIQSIHDEIVSNVRENLHYLDVSLFNHILSGSRYALLDGIAARCGSWICAGSSAGRSEQRGIIMICLIGRLIAFTEKKDAGTLPKTKTGERTAGGCDGADRRADIDRDPGTSAHARLSSGPLPWAFLQKQSSAISCSRRRA